LVLACDYWLRKANRAGNDHKPLDYVNRGNLPANKLKLEAKETRRAGIVALQQAVEGWLEAHGAPHTTDAIEDSLTRENRGVRAGHHFADIIQWNARHAQRLPDAISTAATRGGFNADPDTRLISLDDDSQKRLAKLVFREGKAYRWTDFRNDSGFDLFSTGNGGVHYVMDKRGRIYAGTLTSGYFWHSSLVGFADALSAGFIFANQGIITGIKNDSGHYHPGAREMTSMVLRLQQYGVNISNLRVERMAGTHALGAANFTGAQMLTARPGQWPDE
jgi:hypothetical protein